MPTSTLTGSLTNAVLAALVVPVPAATLTDLSKWRPSEVLDVSAEARPLVAADALPAPQLQTHEATRPWIAHVEENARALSALRAGWDGYGSIPISRTVLYRATSYVKFALEGLSDIAPPRLVPGGDGSVQIEWHLKHGELEFDIGPRDEMTIWIRDRRNGAEFEGEDEAALALFYRWAPWIASQQRDGSHATDQAQMPFFSVAA